MSSVRRRRIWALAALPAGLALLCIVGLVVAGVRLSRTPRTHVENVRATLERRALAYQDIALSQNYEESVDFDFFRAQVQVRMRDGRLVNGWLGCENRDSQCFLELRGLGIVGERMPELARDPPWPWLAWLRSELRDLGVSL
jgi:hypothetical protein